MKRKLLLTLLFAAVFGLLGNAQDFSNKGKEFWLAYCYHVGMTSGQPPAMTLYLTSDVNTTYTVEIYGGANIATGSIGAGQVVTVTIPTTYFIDNEGLFQNKAIRVTAVNPIVVYSYITRSAASGATLCLPTPVLGKEYYSANFTQSSNENLSNSYFTIVAVEDNTTVEITPSAATKNGWAAGNAYTVTLNKGQIYQVLGVTTNLNGVDLTGSKIKSIASGTGGCKRIAVFSGSGKIRIPATGCSSNSSDNLYQQLYPSGSWGKKYLTVPSKNNVFNYYRIIKSDPTAVVTVNGSVVPAGSFVNGVYYQFLNNLPNSIEADKPISVVQYFTTQGCDGNSNSVPNDPDMIVLNPVEQNIDKVTLVNSNLYAAASAQFPHQHHIHVIMRNGGTGISSFTFDGTPVPASSWVTHPGDPSYSYLYLANVAQGYHRLVSDSGFNALAYGYASAESYGYSAGANVKDLYQFASIKNQYATVSFPAACRNSPFYFSMTFPYQPTQIKWSFNGLFPDVTVNTPVHDSSWVLNGKTLYRYTLPNTYTIPAIGTYPIKVIAQNPTPDGCSGEQEISYDLQVYERPVADFNFTTTGCLTDSVHFTDNSNTNGRSAIIWSYDFGDNTTSSLKNPVHLYATAGTYNVKFSIITDIGCLSDTVTKSLTISQPPVANFGISAPRCQDRSVTFTDSSSSATSAIVKWYWNFGNGGGTVTVLNNSPQTVTYTAAGTYTVTLKVESATGCQSTVMTKTVIVSPNPVVDFSFGNACLPAGALSFTNNTTIADGTGPALGYSWDFGNNTASTQKDPVATYAAVGPYSVKLVVTAPSGCKDSLAKTVNTVYAQPQAAFTVTDSVCAGSSLSFTDASTAASSTITKWHWDFGNGDTSIVQNPVYTYANPGTYTVKLVATSAIGCASTVATKKITVNALPAADFTFSSPVCVTRNITFTSTATSDSGILVKWTWNMGDGGASQVRTSAAPFTYPYATTGSFNVTLQAESSKGCKSAVKTKTVEVYHLPLPNFILPDNCLNDPFSLFKDSSTIADGTESAFTYLWNFGDPNASGANPNTSTLKNPKHKYSVVGPYDVTLTVTSSHGCSAAITKQLVVNGTLPQSIFTVNGGSQYCSNDSVRITNNSSVDVGKIVKLEIQWDFANSPGTKQTVPLPAPGAVFTHGYPSFVTPATRSFVIRVVAYSGDSCFAESQQTVVLKAIPDVQFAALTNVCADQPAFNFTQGVVTNLSGTGVYSGTATTAAGQFDPATAGVGTYTIRYTFNANNGCTDFREQPIKVFPVPTVNAGQDLFVLEGGTGVLGATASGNSLSYAWTPASWLNHPDSLRPVTTPLDDVTYTLKVTSADGCTASDAVVVKVLKMPSIPNVFSPNGDGVNDRWEIKYLESYPGATIEIYNRYGQLVFQSVGYSKPWDGSFKGAQVPAGTYYYIINPKNGRKQIAGFVDIVR